MAKLPKNKVTQSKSLFIAAGHSDSDPGAVGNGYREADIVLEFRDLLAAQLRNKGIEFTKDGIQGENLPLNKAIRMAQLHDVSVEFHCNAFTDPRATGVETLSHPRHFKEGEHICKTISRFLGINNRGAKGEASGEHSRLGFISRGNGIIVELFFITNPDDLAIYWRKKNDLAHEVSKALIDLVCDNLSY